MNQKQKKQEPPVDINKNKKNVAFTKWAESIGWNNPDMGLLQQALMHPTYFEGAQSGLRQDNQRLEFLGDAVLDMLISEELFWRYPQKKEGDLSKMRAAVVCEAALAKAARKIHLGPQLLLGKGSEKSGDRDRESVLADAMEAVVGAMFLAFGLKKTCELVLKVLKEDLMDLDNGNYDDHKGLLQQYVQSNWDKNIIYKVLETSGPDHNRSYKIGVFLAKQCLAEATAGSKKEAEQTAAALAWQKREEWTSLVAGERNV